MVAQHNIEGFGGCTNIGECEAVCPKEIKLESIAHLNHDFLAASLRNRANMTPVSRTSKYKRDPLHVEG
jgi:ferredoxin